MKIVITSLFFIGSLILAGVFLTPLTTKGQKEEKEEPTVIQKGEITEKEREYSKQYQKLYSNRNGQKLTVISEMGKRKGNKKEAGVSIGIPTIPTIGNATELTLLNFLRELSCKADAVVLGSIQSKSAHLTEDETFVYTEYEFLVADILKNNSTSPIETDKNIEVTRPGGLIKLDNQVIRLEDKSYEPLQLKNNYLLFLSFIPAANGYMVSDAKGDFLLKDSYFEKLSKFSLPEELENNNDSQVLLDNVRGAVSIRCGQLAKGENI